MSHRLLSYSTTYLTLTSLPLTSHLHHTYITPTSYSSRRNSWRGRRRRAGGSSSSTSWATALMTPRRPAGSTRLSTLRRPVRRLLPWHLHDTLDSRTGRQAGRQITLPACLSFCYPSVPHGPRVWPLASRAPLAPLASVPHAPATHTLRTPYAHPTHTLRTYQAGLTRRRSRSTASRLRRTRCSSCAASLPCTTCSVRRPPRPDPTRPDPTQLTLPEGPVSSSPLPLPEPRTVTLPRHARWAADRKGCQGGLGPPATRLHRRYGRKDVGRWTNISAWACVGGGPGEVFKVNCSLDKSYNYNPSTVR